MIGTLPRQSRVPSSRFALHARPFELASGAILRYSLVVFLLLFGLAKFTEGDALTIQPWVANSPFLGWLYAVTTPDLSPAWSGFLMKDLVLLGAALWTAADSLRAIERRTQ